MESERSTFCGLYLEAHPSAMALAIETESRIYRSLRAVFGATAHLASIGFTIFIAVCARPGSSK